MGGGSSKKLSPEGSPGPKEPKPEPEPPQTRLIRAQQSLNFMKALNDRLLPPESPCNFLDFDMLILIAAMNPPAERWAFGRYTVDIKWNGTYTLVLDEVGAHWGKPAASSDGVGAELPCGPYSLNDRHFCMTLYNPTASTVWSGRHGGTAGQKGMTESLDVHFEALPMWAAAAVEGGGGEQQPPPQLRTFTGTFQREFEGPLPCTGYSVSLDGCRLTATQRLYVRTGLSRRRPLLDYRS